MGEIHELFVLAVSLVWFAGATPDLNFTKVRNLENAAAVSGIFSRVLEENSGR